MIGPVHVGTPKPKHPCGKPSSGVITRPDSGAGRLRIGLFQVGQVRVFQVASMAAGTGRKKGGPTQA
jgi:hypothetical protein